VDLRNHRDISIVPANNRRRMEYCSSAVIEHSMRYLPPESEEHVFRSVEPRLDGSDNPARIPASEVRAMTDSHNGLSGHPGR
jgi:hypothetical protein